MTMNLQWLRESSALKAVVVVGLALTLGMTSGCGAKNKAGAEGEEGWGTEEGLASASSLSQYETQGTVASGGNFEDVYFEYDSSTLPASVRESISRNAEWLTRNSSTSVEIEGHCDERGTSEYNLALGARRAKAVRDALIAEGISASRLSTVSYGEELPVCRESNESCWQRNRRGHLVDLTAR
jgi:peptidoglycan-associated lipoprotein